MESLNIQTTQNVDIHYEVASIGDRLLARLLDWIIFIVYYFAFFVIVGQMRLGLSYGIIVLMLLPILTYDLWCETFFQGRSFGKMIMKLRVVRLDGGQPGFGDYLIRWLLRLIEGMAALSPGLCLLVVVINGRGQRIGDIIAGTTLIKTGQRVQLRDTILMQMNPNYVIVFPQVAVLSDRDVNIIRDVLKQAMTSQNYPVVERLAARVKEVMGVYPMMPSMQFLHIVLSDYTHYSFEGK